MYVICGRPDLGEEYLAELPNPSRDPLRPEIDPIVRIARVMRYPRQHALYWPDVPVEIPPIADGVYCRLRVFRQATEADMRRYADYAESLAAAQREYMTRCESAAEREIVQRHMHGEYRRRRMERYFDKGEVGKYL